MLENVENIVGVGDHGLAQNGLLKRSWVVFLPAAG